MSSVQFMTWSITCSRLHSAQFPCHPRRLFHSSLVDWGWENSQASIGRESSCQKIKTRKRLHHWEWEREKKNWNTTEKAGLWVGVKLLNVGWVIEKSVSFPKQVLPMFPVNTFLLWLKYNLVHHKHAYIEWQYCNIIILSKPNYVFHTMWCQLVNLIINEPVWSKMFDTYPYQNKTNLKFRNWEKGNRFVCTVLL